MIGPAALVLRTYRGFEALAMEALRDLRAEKDRQLSQHDARIEALAAENSDLRLRLEALESTVQRLVQERQRQ